MIVHGDQAPSASPEPPAVEVSGLRVVLGDRTVLRGVDLVVRRGSRLALVGPNGAGKSTLLRAIAGLVRASGGEVRVEGQPLAADPWRARRAVGLVGHQSMLHPDLTVRENLQLYAQLYGLERVGERVERGLRLANLVERGHSRAATLSRGMIQRLALARSLLHEPTILLLDEAETGLDARSHDVLTAALGDDLGQRTVILASHDLRFVREACGEIAFLVRGRVVGCVQLAGLDDTAVQECYGDVLAARRAERPGRRQAVGAGGSRDS
jgi:heme exporter protein A